MSPPDRASLFALIALAAVLGSHPVWAEGASGDDPAAESEISPEEATTTSAPAAQEFEETGEEPAAPADREREVAPDPTIQGRDDLADLGLGDLDDFDLGDLGLEDEFALLYAEDVVVSATRHEQRISESPSTITVITREDLDGGYYRDLADILRMVPGADVYRINPMTVNVGFRAGTTGTANRVLLLVDGRDMAVHTTGQPQWNSLPIDIGSIERIEIIRGPGSSIYGANALQGVVNVITRRSTDEALAVEGEAGLAGPLTYAADLRAHGTLRGVRWWTSAGYDQESLYEKTDVLGYRALRLRGRVDFDLTEDLTTLVEGGFGEARGRFGSPVGDGKTRWTNPYLLAKLRWPDSEVQVSIEQSGALIEPENRLISPAGTLRPEPVDLGGLEPLDLHSQSIELTGFHAFNLSGGHRLMLGGAGRVLQHLEGAVLQCPDVEKADFDLGMCDAAALLELRGGAFVQAELRLTEALGLTTGLRADANSIHPELGLSPRLALVWTPWDGQSLRASAGRAYRKPSFFESHLNLKFSPTEEVPGEIASRLQYLFAVDAPNPNLGNETVTAIETGWLGRFAGGRLVTSVDLYYLRFTNRMEGIIENIEFVPGLIGSVSLHPDARITYANRSEPQWAIGGELAVTARPRPWIRLDAHYNHQGIYDVNIEDGERVSELSSWTPRHRINLAARLDAPGGVRLGISAHWSSSYTRYIQDPESSLNPLIFGDVGNNVLLLGSASYRLQLMGSEMEIGVGGRNLLFSEIREIPGISREADSWGGEILKPQARIFLRGRF